MRTSRNSSAIDRVPGTRSKSDEFSEVRMAVQKLFTYKCLKPLKTCCTFWDPDSERAPRVHRERDRSAGAVYGSRGSAGGESGERDAGDGLSVKDRMSDKSPKFDTYIYSLQPSTHAGRTHCARWCCIARTHTL